MVIRRFTLLGVLLLVARSYGLFESDIILPEDPVNILPDRILSYDLKVPNPIQFNPEGTALSQISEADPDPDHISIDSSSDGTEEQDEVELFQASTQLTDLLVQKCTSANFTKFNWITAFCDSLSGPTEQALQSALGSLGDAGITSLGLEGIAFSVGSVSIGDVSFGYHIHLNIVLLMIRY